jgi:uncharacterized membrane protein
MAKLTLRLIFDRFVAASEHEAKEIESLLARFAHGAEQEIETLLHIHKTATVIPTNAAPASPEASADAAQAETISSTGSSSTSATEPKTDATASPSTEPMLEGTAELKPSAAGDLVADVALKQSDAAQVQGAQ